MKQSMVAINKAGGAGAEGFLDVKGAKGDPHKIIITLSNLFTTPLATGVPFNWKDLTPVQMMALDQFVLWVNAEAPYKTAKEYVEAAKKAGANKFKMGGTGSKQEDQIITVALEKQTGAKFTYIPFKGGGDVATQLVGKHVDSTVNNPIEAVAQWRGGKLRPLCVFDAKRMPYKEKVTDNMSWNDIPTCKEGGRRRRLPDAARHLHGRRRHARPGRSTTSTCSRRCGDAGVEGVHGGGRVQPHHARPARSTPTGSRSEEARHVHAHEGSRLPRREVARHAGCSRGDEARQDRAGGRQRRFAAERRRARARRASRRGSLRSARSWSATAVRLGSAGATTARRPGYFPFYIGLIICIASRGQPRRTRCACRRARATRPSSRSGQLKLVLTVLVPRASTSR